MSSVDPSDVDVDLASCTANTAPGAIEEEARLMAGAQVFFSSRRGGSVCRRRQLIVTSWLDEMHALVVCGVVCRDYSSDVEIGWTPPLPFTARLRMMHRGITGFSCN